MRYGRQNNLVVFTALQLKASSSKEIRSKAKKVSVDADVSAIEVNTEDYSGSQAVIQDADNAIGCVLNHDHPPTKMYLSFSKSRDDESRITRIVDFDGKIGSISDPEYTAQQIQDTQDLLYGSPDSTEDLEEKLKSDDGLFSRIELDDPEDKIEKSEIEESSDVVEEVLKMTPENVTPRITQLDPTDFDTDTDTDTDTDDELEDLFGPNELGD